MAKRNIVTKGDEILSKKCKEVTAINERTLQTLQDMFETMEGEEGVGIAAPQVGVMRRMFIARPEEDRIYYMINPVMLEQRGSQETTEACLSVPGMMGEVIRPEYIKIKALNREGQEKTYEFYDFDAVVMCHEYDHLEGILYTEKASNLRRMTDDNQEENE